MHVITSQPFGKIKWKMCMPKCLQMKRSYSWNLTQYNSKDAAERDRKQTVQEGGNFRCCLGVAWVPVTAQPMFA